MRKFIVSTAVFVHRKRGPKDLGNDNGPNNVGTSMRRVDPMAVEYHSVLSRPRVEWPGDNCSAGRYR